MLPGFLLYSLTETAEDDKYSPFDKEDDDEQDREIQLIALRLIDLGALVFYGDEWGLEGYDIYERFDDVNDVTVNVSTYNLSKSYIH